MSEFAFSFVVGFLPSIFLVLFAGAGLWMGVQVTTALTNIDWHAPSQSGLPAFLGMVTGLLAGIMPAFFMVIAIIGKGGQ